MIVRPLNLAERLRAVPVWNNWVSWLNVGALALFFVLFGSRFVLAPGLPLQAAGLQPPTVPGAAVALARSSTVVSIKANGQIFTPDLGRTSFPQLKPWLVKKAKEVETPALLIVADQSVSFVEISRLYAAATEAGFRAISLAAEPEVANESR